MAKRQLKPHIKHEVVRQILSSKISITSVSSSLNIHKSTIYRWIEKSKNNIDITRKPVIRTKKIAGSKSERLLTILTKPANRYGFNSELWTAERVRQVALNILEINISRMTMNRTLKFYLEPRKEELRQLVKFSKIKGEYSRSNLYIHQYLFITLSNDRTKILHFDPATDKYAHPRHFFTVLFFINLSGRSTFKIYKGINAIKAKYLAEFIEQLLLHNSKKKITLCLPETPTYNSKLLKNLAHKYRTRLKVIQKPIEKSPYLFSTF